MPNSETAVGHDSKGNHNPMGDVRISCAVGATPGKMCDDMHRGSSTQGESRKMRRPILFQTNENMRQ